MINFYRRFIPECAEVAALLNRLTTGENGVVNFNHEHVAAFNTLKALLSDATMLAHPKPNTGLVLLVDASSTAVGAALNQEINDVMKPIAFFSKTLTPTETRYSTFGRELLGIYLSVRHFRHFIEAARTIVFTDHKPLLSAVSSKSSKYTDREIRQLDFLSQFNIELRHIMGTESVVADALSRVNINTLHNDDGINLQEIAREQRSENLHTLDLGINVREIPVPNSNTKLICTVSTGQPRPLIPQVLRRKVFETLHNLSHPSIRSTIKLISDRFAWPDMKHDIRIWSRECTACQRSKVHRHTKSPIGTIKTPDARFSHVHIDLVGPLLPSNGHKYLFTCVDRFTRWPEAIPIPDITAETLVHTFLMHWVAKFGAPQYVTTDRGQQFESRLFKSLMEFLGCQRIRTTSYHPAANGLVERFHRKLKAALMSQENRDHWVENLPLVLLGIRSSIKEDLHCSTAEMVYGTTLRLPGELIDPSSPNFEDTANLLDRLRQFARTIKPTSPRTTSTPSYVDKRLHTCTHVLVRNDKVKRSLQPQYDGPFQIISRTDKTFTIQMNNRKETISIDRVKAAWMEDEQLNKHSSTTSTSTPQLSTTPSATTPSATTPLANTLPTTTTRSGRRVHFPDRLVITYFI